LIKRSKIIVTGRVQGVGFRPAVYRIAGGLSLSGFVYNDSLGVVIEVQGEAERIAEFISRLKGKDKPPLARIEDCRIIDIPPVKDENMFVIRKSIGGDLLSSEVAADMAVCDDCLCEMHKKDDLRYRYPFINCTNCGPRYTIVKTIPYDRPNTTMSGFAMCDECRGEYEDVGDRRFHAQPVACGRCGPKIWLCDNKGKILETENDKVIKLTVKMLLEGRIAAIKGIGGFHLAVDALNDEAVRRLRERKRREHKPFAMMTDSIEKIKKFAFISEEAERILEEAERPIVLLPKRKDSAIAASVAEGAGTYGFMLCYAPLHYLLFEEGVEVLVMTSGNMSDEPLICENQKALEKLGDVADIFLMHNRDIYRQVDDSIVQLIDNEQAILRRARGFVPTPLITRRATEKQILAAGADLKNTFSFYRGNQIVCSEHIGDLENAEVFSHYKKSIEHLRKLFEFEPEIIACDLHPGYFSTQYALSIPDIKKIQIQHHWAHIGSVLAEYNIDGPVIGIAADGTGYGSDGAVWGCECLIASLTDYQRFGHLDYYKLAGADKAGKEAIRPALALLQKAYQGDYQVEKFRWLLERIEADLKKVQVINRQIEKGVNTVLTSSLGRVFDAVGAMAGLGGYNYFEAELPMALEAIIAEGVEEKYDYDFIIKDNEPVKIDLRKMIKQIVCDVEEKVDAAIISAKFHNGICDCLLSMAEKAREKTGLETIALSGGVFCNRYLSNRLKKILKRSKFCVLFKKEIPANDGGISVGQAAIAAKKFELRS
jgi:hydrogenase maturation protein HypF